MSAEQDQTRSVMELVVALAGPAIWFAHFAAVYATQGFACGHGALAGTLHWVMVALSVLALAALGGILVSGYRRAERDRADANTADHWSFMHYLRLAITALAAVAVMWTTFAVLMLTPCAAVFG